MAITPTELTAGGTSTDATSFVTASITPQANDPIHVCVYSSVSGSDPNIPTVTGNSITWTQVITKASTVAQTQHRRITLFRGAAASPATGTITFDFAGQTQSSCSWKIVQYDGADQTGAEIVQSNSAEGTNVSNLAVPLNAFADPTNNVAFGFFMHQVEEDSTPGTGFTRIGTDQKLNTPSSGVIAEWRTGEP